MPYTYTDVDHIDENKSNNNVCNLRWYPHWKNVLRSKKSKGWYKASWGYIPRIKIQGKKISFPSCKTSEEAHQVYLTALEDALCID